MVIKTQEEAQEWGHKNDATAVIWGWQDEAGSNTLFQLIDASQVPIEGLPEKPFDDIQTSRRYVRSDLPAVATYLALLGTGLTAAEYRDPAAAIRLLSQAETAWAEIGTEEQVSLTESWLGLGFLYWFRGWTYANAYETPDLESAIAEYERALEIPGPHLPLTHLNLGLAYRVEDPAKGIEHLQAFTEQAASDFANELPAGYRYLGNELCLAGRPDEADAAFESASRLAPKDRRIPLSWGWCAYRDGDLAKAERLYKQAQALDAKYVWPYFNLALVYLLRNEVAAAQQAYETGLRLVPEMAGTGSKETPAEVYREALGDLDQLLQEHPDLEDAAAPLRQMLVDAEKQSG